MSRLFGPLSETTSSVSDFASARDGDLELYSMDADGFLAELACTSGPDQALFFGEALAVEPRYISDFIARVNEDTGLTFA